MSGPEADERPDEAHEPEGYDGAPPFLAMGAAQVAAGMSQGLPIGASGSRTAVNDAMGARSQVAGLPAAGAVALVLLFLTGPIADLPKAVLGAVIVVAAAGLIDSPRRLVQAVGMSDAAGPANEGSKPRSSSAGDEPYASERFIGDLRQSHPNRMMAMGPRAVRLASESGRPQQGRQGR